MSRIAVQKALRMTALLLAFFVAAQCAVEPAAKPGCQLKGIVVDAKGKPVRLLTLALVPSNDVREASPDDSWDVPTKTDRTGRFRFAGLPTGDFSIVALLGPKEEPSLFLTNAGGLMKFALEEPECIFDTERLGRFVLEDGKITLNLAEVFEERHQ